MNNKKVKINLLLLAGIIAALSLTSCVEIEMRDADLYTKETGETEESAVRMLAPAEKENTVGTAPETEAEEEPENLTTVHMSFAGRITTDEKVITDAANRASDGKSYSFLKMYTGVYNAINGADLSVCSYAPAKNEEGENIVPPVESIGALYDMGLDMVNTSSKVEIGEYLSEYEMVELGSDSEAEIEEINGLRFAFLSVGGDSPVAATGDNMKSEVEYADFQSDVVVVYVNWDEGTKNADMKKISYDIASAGADIIIGNGSTLGGAEWLDTGDGTLTLAAYSLGNLVGTSESIEGLLGGVLELDVTANGEAIEISGASIIPTVVQYTADGGYQVFSLKDYSDEISEKHAMDGVTRSRLESVVKKAVSAEFLPDWLNG